MVFRAGETLIINQRSEELLGNSIETPELFEANLGRLFELQTEAELKTDSSEPDQAEIWFQHADGIQHLCEVKLPNNPEQELWLLNSISAQRQNERLLKRLTRATSDVTGDEFFKRLVQELSHALKMKYVCLVQHQRDQSTKCKTFGVSVDGKPGPDFEYDIVGSPCEHAIGKDPYSVHQGVSGQYPQDEFLIKNGIESYFSLPMIDKDGEVQGHLMLLGDRPVFEDLCKLPVIRNYTYRAAAELSRAQAEKKLQESELRITMAARGSSIGFWEYDLTTGQVYFDEHWYAMLGYGPGEFPEAFARLQDLKEPAELEPAINQAWTQMIHPDDYVTSVKALNDYISGKSSSYDVEVRIKKKDGTWKWVFTRGRISAYSPQKVPLQIIGTHIDIDDLKRSQQIRLESEARLRIIMDQIPAILWTTDLDNQYTSIVGAGLNQLGIQPAETVGKGIYNFHKSQDVSVNMTAMHQRTLKGESVRFEQQFENTYLDIHIEPLRNMNDEIIGCIGLAIDVTVRKKTIEQLNRQRILLQIIFHSVTDAMIVTDRSHNIVMCNESIQIHFRCQEADLLGRPVRELIVSSSLYEEQFNRVSFPNTRVLKPFIVEYRRADGSRFQGETIVTPLRRSDNQITGYIKVIRDITDRIQIEEEKDHLHAQMLHAQKLESLGVLAGGVAHDFNNLLLAILGNTNLVLMELDEESPVAPYVKSIEMAARHAAKICERLLAYSGRRTFASMTFNLNRVIQETVEIMKSIVSPNAPIDLDLSAEELMIHGDTGQIEQVVLNLLTNASEAIQNQAEAGKIKIRTGVSELGKDEFSEYYFCENGTPGRFVFLEVEDNGSGMDADCQSKMFDPFFTTKFTGRGLGLAGVSGIIRGHHGGLHVESITDRGSCFRVILPLAVEASVDLDDDGSAESQVPVESGSILVIDDDLAVCKVVNRVLQRFGFSVMTAYSGNEGLDLYENHRDEISVILLDMTMPGLSGVETFELLRKKGVDIPVILTSGLSETDISEQMQGSEIVHFLKKPYKPQKLVNVISKALIRQQIQDDASNINIE
ncbi:PAS domain-containing hybrid sensor histidine kinase/response regulator [Gimesia algae]|uniref:PAS domain-containing hybrid sensor histidine kinase/response regulator n=1 Tax=Gimesia algae TaxID=2527971 RepID=UPI0018D854D7|nr:PAS domain S-box protein [Gimesia algae]